MKRKLVIAAVATSVALGAGTAVAFAGDDGRGGTSGTSASDASARADTARPASAGATRVTAAEAITKALESRPGTAVSAELDDDGSGWEVGVLGRGTTSYEVVVDPATGRVLDTRTDDDSTDDDRDDAAEDAAEARAVRALLKNADVTAEEAARAAAAKGVVTSVDLDDDGTGAWDVETGGGTSAAKERDWTVDLKSGTVTADRQDTQDGEDRDGDDD